MEISKNQPDEELQDKIYRFVGDTIGEVEDDRVRNVIEAMESYGYMVHGIKDESDYPGVKNGGIATLTPEDIEGGAGKDKGVSFWSSGIKSFHSGNNDFTGWATYDSTFFHWAHARNVPPGTRVMNIALTTIDRLNKNGIQVDPKIRRDGYFTMPFGIPSSALTLLKVIIHEGNTKLPPRDWGQLIERQMFGLLEKAVLQGSSPGSELVVELNADDCLPQRMAA